MSKVNVRCTRTDFECSQSTSVTKRLWSSTYIVQCVTVKSRNRNRDFPRHAVQIEHAAVATEKQTHYHAAAEIDQGASAAGSLHPLLRVLIFILYDCKQLGLLDSLVCVWGVCVTHHNSLTVSVGCSIGSNGRLEYSPKSERNQGRTLARFQYQCPCALCVSLLVSMARTTLKTVSTKVLSSVACIIESHRSVSGNGTRTVPYSMDTHNIIAQLHGRES